MTVRVAVVDPLPMYARGLATTIAEDGPGVDVPPDVLEWVRRPGPAAVVLTVAADLDWALLADVLRARPDATVVAVVPSPEPALYLRAVSAGAVAVLPRDAPALVVREVVRAALGGRSVLPVDVLRALVAGAATLRPSRPLSDGEIDWLRQLAEGSTVARLAQRAGYSERMMFRLLSDLYTRLGATSRTRAIMRARDEGWL